MRTRALLCLVGGLVVITLVGCAGAAALVAYIGGGLPPGDTDIGGVVLADASVAAVSVAPAQATVPVEDAEVVLYRGQNEVGRTRTGPGGYFRFQQPDTGAYRVTVEPPSGSGLLRAERQFQHQYGQQTYLTIVLDPEP
jgi:hypothetical protein